MCGIAALLLAPSTLQLHDKLQRYASLVCSTLVPRGPDAQGSRIVSAAVQKPNIPNSAYSFLSAATVLHLRGDKPTAQPFTGPVIDSLDPPFLCFNGEIYSGLPGLTPDGNDTAALHELLTVSTSASPLLPLSSLDGEYAFTFYQAATSTLWFGRDPMGRRSLLAAMGDECGLCVSSVVLDGLDEWQGKEWTELPVSGIFSVDVSRWAGTAVLEVWLHYWPHVRRACPALPERTLVRSMADAQLDPFTLLFPRADLLTSPSTDTLCHSITTLTGAAVRLGELLSDSVRERVTTCPPPVNPSDAAVAILFSGGLDCTLLAHYAHLHTPADQPIDLINVAFIGQLPSSSALLHCPDRITAHNSLHELQLRHPARHFRLIYVDVSLAGLEAARQDIVRVLRPRDTVMDFNIGVVLSFGAKCEGYLVERAGEWIKSRHGRYRTETRPEAHGEPKEEMMESEKDDGKAEEVPAMDAVNAHIHAADQHIADYTASPEVTDESKWTEEEKQRRANPLYGYKRTPAARKANIRRRKQLANQQHQAHRQQRAHTNNNDDESEEAESIPTADEFAAASIAQPPPGPLYTSRAKVLLVGIGADEMFAGYARHRTILRSTGEAALSRALSADVSRLWLRNLGRDDRVTAQHARELRTPFLSAPLLHFWQQLPLSALHTLPSPLGGKAVLREAGRQAGLIRVSGLEKRAMQFGSRVSNRRVVGWVRMSDSVQVREIVNPLFLRQECRPTGVRGEIEKREAKRERGRKGIENQSTFNGSTRELDERDFEPAQMDAG